MEIIIFLGVIIFFLPIALKKMQRIYLAVPFLLLSLLIILNAGLWDKHSFVDSDLIFHKTLVDTIIDPSLFQKDAAIEYYLKTYPRGYHIMLALLSNFQLSVPQISKLLGLFLAIIIPFIFYFLADEIYQDKQTAFLSGFFCGIASIGHTVYSGLPRSIGMLLFLSGLLCLFKIRNSLNKISYFIGLNISMLLLLLIHPYTFIILWLVSWMFFLYEMLGARQGGETVSAGKKYACMFIFILLYAAIFWLFKQKNLITLSSWAFVNQHKHLYYNRVPYAFFDLFKLIKNIGILPVLLFTAAAFNFINKPELRKKYSLLRFLFIAVLFLLFLVILIMRIDLLFFLKAHRFAPFISLLMYLASIWTLKDIWSKLRHTKILTVFLVFSLFTPSVIDLRSYLQAPRLPYDLDGICLGISKPGESELDFLEILELSDFIKKNIPKNELIACALDRGDILRMYAKRPVTASWEIGGMITTYKDAFFIYQQQISDSKLLYHDPERLFQLYGVKYYFFEKAKIANEKEFMSKFENIWESENIYFSVIRM